MNALDLDHSDWSDAEPVQIAHYWSGEEAPPQRHAEARLLWSSDALYARFSCNQSEPLVVSAAPNLREKTNGLWNRDVCEMLIAPDPNFHYRYFEFEAAPTGEWIDLAICMTGDERVTDTSIRSGMSSLARAGERLVTIAMRVPWSAFGRLPRQGDKWRGNLCRCVGTGEHRGFLAWRPTGTVRANFHVPDAFGWFNFEG